MIRRMYADNYKCLVNFECQFDDINLVMGVNGSGKSTVFDALRDIRDFVTGKSPIGLFKDSTLTRWQKRDLQTFELDVEGNGGLYRYRLEIEHERGEDKQRVQLEQVLYDGQPLYRSELGEAHLYHDDHKPGPDYPKDWTQSGLPFLGERPDNRKITWLKKWFKENLYCLQIEPVGIERMWSGEETELARDCTNFVGYYRHLIQSEPQAMISLFDALKDLYEGFGDLRLEPEGANVRHLYATIGIEEEKGRQKNIPLSFGELSDGERALIVLYTLLYLVNEPNTTLCLDEPDNYIALAEIQPWLVSLREKIEAGDAQALLISHHPELIDYLAPRCGLVFERDRNGPTRVRRFEAEGGEECLAPSEIVARGWE